LVLPDPGLLFVVGISPLPHEGAAIAAIAAAKLGSRNEARRRDDFFMGLLLSTFDETTGTY
jgi:hypothetical protein